MGRGLKCFTAAELKLRYRLRPENKITFSLFFKLILLIVAKAASFLST